MQAPPLNYHPMISLGFVCRLPYHPMIILVKEYLTIPVLSLCCHMCLQLLSFTPPPAHSHQCQGPVYGSLRATIHSILITLTDRVKTKVHQIKPLHSALLFSFLI